VKTPARRFPASCRPAISSFPIGRLLQARLESAPGQAGNGGEHHLPDETPLHPLPKPRKDCRFREQKDRDVSSHLLRKKWVPVWIIANAGLVKAS